MPAFHPVNVPRHPYRGDKPHLIDRKRDYDRAAAKIEKWLRVSMESEEPGEVGRSFSYLERPENLAIDDDLANEILSSIDGGLGGVTIVKLK